MQERKYYETNLQYLCRTVSLSSTVLISCPCGVGVVSFALGSGSDRFDVIRSVRHI